MSAFTDVLLEKKLLELSNSQQSIQTLSLWLIHHRKHHKTIVQVWFRELLKANSSRKLAFMYLANDVIQNNKKKVLEFSKEFSRILSIAFAHVYRSVSDEKTKSRLERLINIWDERRIYNNSIINGFRTSMNIELPILPVKMSESKSLNSKRKSLERKIKVDIGPISKKRKLIKEEIDVVKSPLDSEELIKTLQDLENCPSTDAVVREKIANLPAEVSDITLLEKVQTREAAEKLSKLVETCDNLLDEYNNRLSDELEHRKQVSKMLNDFTRAQRERAAATERQLKEFKEKLKRVSQIRHKLDSHVENLPDLTLLPCAIGGLPPLPSASDLFNQP